MIAVVGVAILSLSAMSLEQKGQAFMRAQAELLARSANEYAIKDILLDPKGFPGGASVEGIRNGKTMTITADAYTIEMQISFVGPEHPEYFGAMLIDTTVTTKKGSAGIDNMPIRYARRTVQKP
jgi:CO dehydrogenase/acetyl-CoA synthase gamma subunit (corrinoid Fe-S protein)